MLKVYALTILPIFTGCASMSERNSECGIRGMEKRVYSYQNGSFGIDFGLKKKNFLQIRYGGGNNNNTEDGFTILPCTQKAVNKHRRRQEKKKNKRSKPPTPVIT